MVRRGRCHSEAVTEGLPPLQNNTPSGETTPFAPKRPFGTFRCCAWLIRIKEHTVLFYSKRSRFSRGAACARGSRRNPSVRCGGQLPLHRGAGERPSAAERARRGSRRNPRPDQRAGVFSRVSRPRSMRRGTSVAWPPSCQVMVTRDAPSCLVSNSSSRR